MSTRRVQSLQNVAQKMIIQDTRMSSDKSTAASRAFKQGNRLYEAGKIEQAIESYRSALSYDPSHWDVWNNLALAEMHKNNDLVALFLLSALTKSNPKYSGASVNLSVCLERLGQDAAAYEVAADLASARTLMPMAQYNMAWFKNSRGKYNSANSYLEKALAIIDGYSVAKWLQAINNMESGRNITDDEMKWLPPTDQTQGIPRVETSSVIVDRADATSRDSLVARIYKGTHIIVSRRSGDWYGFYWPVDDTKRLLWAKKASFGELIETASYAAIHDWIFGKVKKAEEKGRIAFPVVGIISTDADISGYVVYREHGELRSISNDGTKSSPAISAEVHTVADSILNVAGVGPNDSLTSGVVVVLRKEVLLSTEQEVRSVIADLFKRMIYLTKGATLYTSTLLMLFDRPVFLYDKGGLHLLDLNRMFEADGWPRVKNTGG
jgi:tetratricopeptide (TPR) repeat protein